MQDEVSITTGATAALLTPRGRGAIATIRLRHPTDPLAHIELPQFEAANGRRLSDQPIGRVVFGRWGHASAEEVVLCRRDARALEIHCHGGDAAAGRILSDLEAAGCRTVTCQEQGTAERGLLASECLDALSRATTLRSGAILLDQAEGTLPAAFERLGENLGSRISDFGSGTADSHFRNPKSEIRNLLAWSAFGLHLTSPWRVVVTGRPNVGKSSLINALLGYARSIVFDQPGTTRDVVTARTAFEGWPVELADTAGLRATAGEIEAAGIAKARQHLAEADCRIVVLDTSRRAEAEDLLLLEEWPDAIVVTHKIDLPDCRGAPWPAEGLRVSSVTGSGVEALAQAIVRRLVPRVPEPGTAIPITARQVELLQRIDAAFASGDQATIEHGIVQLLG